MSVSWKLPSNVRLTACVNTCLFGDGAQYQVNSTMVENQVNYYQAAMVKLYTKYDSHRDKPTGKWVCQASECIVFLMWCWRIIRRTTDREQR
eukprot:COSAG02_NODE_1599_length_11754_cov_6.319005_9_plen_92_part_00